MEQNIKSTLQRVSNILLVNGGFLDNPGLYLLLCLLCVNCTHTVKMVEADKGTGIKEIEVMENISNSQKINLSSVASSIDYCVLESDAYCYITPSMAVYCSQEHVIAIGGAQGREACYIFDRNTGHFVRQISRRGQGPNEYLEVVRTFWDGDKNQIAVWNGLQYFFFNLDGSLSHKTTGRFSWHDFVSYNDFYITLIPNFSGKQTIRIAFHDKTGALVDSIPEYRTWERTETRLVFSIYFGQLYNFQNARESKDIFCDTLYHVKDFSLYPRFIFNTGNRAVPYKIQEGGRYDYTMVLNGGGYDAIIDRYEKYVVVNKILEDVNNLYFTFDYKTQLYSAIYNKTKDNLQIMPPTTITPPPRLRAGGNGFENDLDGGLPFWPQQMISEKEMMCVYTAEQLFSLDASKITNEKLKMVLSRLDEDSNPVVAIVTIKE